MSFLQSQYIIPVISFLLILIVIFARNEAKYFNWIKDHWFFKRSKKNKLASIFYYLGFLLLGLALLDLRGPEKHITGKVSDQKTTILIDSSSSMMAEDVRPNRFEKAIVLAKHYVRKAVGQQISVAVFSDTQKRIIPFTNDVDLVDARLDALKDMKLNRGGTSLSLAIQESIQYFANSSGEVSGNILIFTDAEETDGGIVLDVPDGISIGVVGIGTAKGAPIPMRNDRNVFIGNKKYNDEVVISKLDERYLKKLGDNVDKYRYWVAGSYSLPTEQVVSFFSRIHKLKESKNSFRIRPVLQNYLMIPGVVFFLLSFMLKNMKSFIYLGSIFLTLNSFAQVEKEKKEEPKKSKEIIRLEEKFAEGEMTKDEKRLLANKLLEQGFAQQSKQLYQEILDDEINNKNVKDYFNKGAAQFKSQDIAQGFKTYKDLYDYLEKNPEGNEKMMEAVKKNMLKAIQSAASQKQNQKQKNEEDDKKNKNSKNQKGEGKGKGNKKEDQKDKGKNGEEQKDKKKKEENKRNKDNKNENKNKQKSNEENKSKVGKKKMPAILKQLMSDDNKLQKKMIDTGTTKRKSREKRDW